MYKVDVLLMIAVVECAELSKFKTNEIVEFWITLSHCAADSDILDEFEDQERESIKRCVNLLVAEFKRRGFKPVDLFQMMRDNPGDVVKVLSTFNLEKLLVLEKNLQDFEQTELVKNFLRLIRQRMMQIVALA